jgi:hypothetical protein
MVIKNIFIILMIFMLNFINDIHIFLERELDILLRILFKK